MPKIGRRMTLRMTRTRTQTTLNRLSAMVACVHGELAAVERFLAECPEHGLVLSRKKVALLGDRDALYGTLKQFDPSLEPENIRASDDWQLKYFKRRTKDNQQRYLAALEA